MEESLSYEFVNTVISTGNIELLESLYKLGLTFKYGKNIIDVINSSIDEINSINQYPLRFANFSQLAKFYHAVKELGRLPFEISNGYLVIARNQKIFFTLDEFMVILSRSPNIRGMRVIFQVSGHGIKFFNYGLPDKEMYDSICIRKLDDGIEFITHVPENFMEERHFTGDPDWGNMLVLTQSRNSSKVTTTYTNFRADLSEELEIVERFFDPNFKPIDSRIRFVSESGIYELSAESLDPGLSMVFLPNLQDDGEYFHTKSDEEHVVGTDDLYKSSVPYIESIIEWDFVTLRSVSFDNYPSSNLNKYDDVSLTKDNLLKVRVFIAGYDQLNTIEEKCSFISFFMTESPGNDERLSDVMGLYYDDTRLESIDEHHACVDTQNETLCLITGHEVSSTWEFDLIDSRTIRFRGMTLYINSIVLI